MRSHLFLENKHDFDLPDRFKDDDVRYTPELVKYFISQFTRPGDMVFDPFAGYGTTLKTAEEMGRKSCGIEYLQDRKDFICSLVHNTDLVVLGDALELASYDLPRFDLSLTSPPYMCRSDRENPFTSYQSEGSGYEAYLEDLKNIYSQMKPLMNEGAHIVIEVSNLKHDGKVTTLAWDIARKLGEILDFQGEVIVNWDTYGYGYEHSYCLIFT